MSQSISIKDDKSLLLYKEGTWGHLPKMSSKNTSSKVTPINKAKYNDNQESF